MDTASLDARLRQRAASVGSAGCSIGDSSPRKKALTLELEALGACESSCIGHIQQEREKMEILLIFRWLIGQPFARDRKDRVAQKRGPLHYFTSQWCGLAESF